MASLGNAASPRQLGCRIIWDPWDAQSEQAGAGFEIEIVAALRQTLRPSPLQHRCGQVGAWAIHHWPGSASRNFDAQTCTSQILELPSRRTTVLSARVVSQAQHISQENEDMYCTVQTHHKSSLPTRPTERKTQAAILAPPARLVSAAAILLATANTSQGAGFAISTGSTGSYHCTVGICGFVEECAIMPGGIPRS